jgi:PilZ domain
MPYNTGRFRLKSQEVPAAIRLLNSLKFDAVIVDHQLKQSEAFLEAVRLSSSNRTAVTFAIGSSYTQTPAAFRDGASFVFDRPLSMESISRTLKPAFRFILRERRRYFRCPISLPVSICRKSLPDVACHSINISESGMAVGALAALRPGEEVQVKFVLSGQAPFVVESIILWCSGGGVGIHFKSLSQDHKSKLRDWLSRQMEDLLPEHATRRFSNPLRKPVP